MTKTEGMVHRLATYPASCHERGRGAKGEVASDGAATHVEAFVLHGYVPSASGLPRTTDWRVGAVPVGGAKVFGTGLARPARTRPIARARSA